MPDWLTELFEFEYCDECSGDAEDHIPCKGPLGLPFAMCKFSPLEEGWALRNGRLQRV